MAGLRSVDLIQAWRGQWRHSAVRQIVLWYVRRWRGQPMRHTGLVVLVALMLYTAGRQGVIESWPAWWLYGVLIVMSLAGLCCGDSWAAIQRTSVVLRWWKRQAAGWRDAHGSVSV